MSGIVRLPEVDQKVFAAVRAWIYTQRLTDMYSSSWKDLEIAQEECMSTFSLLIGVWVFAELHGMPELQDHAIDDLLRFTKVTPGYPVPETIRYLYDNTQTGCPLRLLFAELFASVSPTLQILNGLMLGTQTAFLYDETFTADCYLAMGKKNEIMQIGDDDHWEQEKCRFHVHEENTC